MANSVSQAYRAAQSGTSASGGLDLEMVVEIEGLDELEEAFTEGSKRAVRKFLRSVEMKAAKVLKDHLSEEAPYRTGELSEDIHTQTVMGDGTMTVRVGPSKETFYGVFQEFGAPEANVPAQHWMENTAREHQDEVLEEYMNAVSEGLQEMKK
jgi:HK97 gp10 family phage protein